MAGNRDQRDNIALQDIPNKKRSVSQLEDIDRQPSLIKKLRTLVGCEEDPIVISDSEDDARPTSEEEGSESIIAESDDVGCHIVDDENSDWSSDEQGDTSGYEDEYENRFRIDDVRMFVRSLRSQIDYYDNDFDSNNKQGDNTDDDDDDKEDKEAQHEHDAAMLTVASIKWMAENHKGLGIVFARFPFIKTLRRANVEYFDDKYNRLTAVPTSLAMEELNNMCLIDLCCPQLDLSLWPEASGLPKCRHERRKLAFLLSAFNNDKVELDLNEQEKQRLRRSMPTKLILQWLQYAIPRSMGTFIDNIFDVPQSVKIVREDILHFIDTQLNNDPIQ